jgi:hypothetical protein
VTCGCAAALLSARHQVQGRRGTRLPHVVLTSLCCAAEAWMAPHQVSDGSAETFCHAVVMCVCAPQCEEVWQHGRVPQGGAGHQQEPECPGRRHQRTGSRAAAHPLQVCAPSTCPPLWLGFEVILSLGFANIGPLSPILQLRTCVRPDPSPACLPTRAEQKSLQTH